MEITFIYMLWFSALVFTVCSFIWRSHLMFSMLAAAFWLATAYSMVQVDYVGFGSTNVITYDHELDDWYGDRQVFRLLAGVGLLMLVYTLYNTFLVAKGDVDEAMRRGGPGYNWEKI